MQGEPAPHGIRTIRVVPLLPSKSERPSRRSSVHLLAGASGGLATCDSDLSTSYLRTRLQSDYYHFLSRPPLKPASTHLIGASLHRLRETVQIINSIHYTEGWRGFFRGLGPSLAGVVPATVIMFYVYGNSKRLGAHILNCGEDAAIVHAQAAITAGILDQSRTQAGGVTARKYKNSLDYVRQFPRHEGIRGLYRALSGINTRNSTIWDELATWASTSGAAVLMTYPHEVVRTRLRQAPKENGVPKYTGLLQCFRLVARQEGLTRLYGGRTPHIVRAIPSSIITLGVYEFVLRLVGS
ncbi:mitochondrial carrier [Lentithecium fluviatile CBS 122367]|uniref:Mitochondrial carrier n=1 Tax=Lentithecium fluviatile CBS 122367 TaxID=1168545 RepID=A0A6G1JG68_9PLEO|nr:mitochondrial carrier [Lentithecium fluviatile CBS 122367]